VKKLLSERLPEGTPEWHKDLVQLYEVGGSDSEAVVILDLTMPKFYALMDEQAAFREIIEQCRALSDAFWDSQGRLNLKNKEFNTPLWIFNMKNRRGWAEKSETRDEKLVRDMNIDELRNRIIKTAPGLIDKIPELKNWGQVVPIKE